MRSRLLLVICSKTGPESPCPWHVDALDPVDATWPLNTVTSAWPRCPRHDAIAAGCSEVDARSIDMPRNFALLRLRERNMHRAVFEIEYGVAVTS